MKKFLLIILSFFFLFWPKIIFATENKFGIHILEPSDIDKAVELVNSSGGDWGYVTIVIRDDDLNFDKWQGFMDECRQKHLIPLVRIATHLKGENWVKPKIEDAEKWSNFLGSLNWPVTDQFVIIFNEPNQAKEWGGEVNPREYARILSGFNEKLKMENEKFKIFNSGFDLAAGNTKSTIDAFRFWQEMNSEIPGIFEKIDGWVSHSYPNHGYLGKPWDKGKTSIRGYEWELWELKNKFKVQKELPIFITETGWPKNQLTVNSQKSKAKRVILGKYYDEATVANYFKYAFENVWIKDDRIKAVTPFLLNYPEPLFADFSWLDKNGEPYLQFETIKNIPKKSWWPEQINKFTFNKIEFPPFLLTQKKYKGIAILTNEGQSILGEKEKFFFKVINADQGIEVSNIFLEKGELLKPFERTTLTFEIKTTTQSGEFNFGWEGVGDYKIKVFQPTFLNNVKFTLWQKIIKKLRFW